MYLPKPRPIRYSNVLKATAFGNVCNEEMSLDANRAYSSYTISKLNGLSCAKSKCAMATRMYTSKRDMSDTRNTTARAAAEVSSGAMTHPPRKEWYSRTVHKGQQRVGSDAPVHCHDALQPQEPAIFKPVAAPCQHARPHTLVRNKSADKHVVAAVRTVAWQPCDKRLPRQTNARTISRSARLEFRAATVRLALSCSTVLDSPQPRVHVSTYQRHDLLGVEQPSHALVETLHKHFRQRWWRP